MSALPHVAVLMGGWSAEREVSLISGRACADALIARDYRVSTIDAGRDLAQVLGRIGPDVVLNALHGRWGEDGCVQGLLEVMGLAYTHSGPRASAVAMHKPTAKRMLEASGIPMPPGRSLTIEEAAAAHVMEPPYVVKPASEGSSVGVHIIRAGDNRYPHALREGWTHGPEVVVERFVPGRELTVAVMEDRALAVTEILPAAEFYDYEAKYAAGGSRHELPAQLPDSIAEEAKTLALAAHRALGCRGVTRTDFRYDDTKGSPGELYVLEVNTQPGMTPTSLVPEQAAHVGMSFADLVIWMIEDASCER